MKRCSSRQGAGGGHGPVEALLRAARAEKPWSSALKVAVGASPPGVLMGGAPALAVGLWSGCLQGQILILRKLTMLCSVLRN